MKRFTVIFSILMFGFSGLVFAQEAIPADAKFLDQFSQHHMDAIKMSKMAEKKVENPELKKIVQKMLKDQSKEVEQMKKWRKDLYPSVAQSSMDMPKMDMTKLEKAKGHEFDMAFADMMAQHHQQGVDMVQKVSDQLSNSKIKQFALQASKNQQEEKKKLEKMAEM